MGKHNHCINDAIMTRIIGKKPKNTEIERAKIEKHIAEFLKGGGEITQIETGESGIKKGSSMFKALRLGKQDARMVPVNQVDAIKES